MPKLKPSDKVLIYPYGGWHYHINGCWMAVTNMPEKTANYIQVNFRDIETLKTRSGGKYIPCDCVKAYESGQPLPKNIFEKEGS